MRALLGCVEAHPVGAAPLVERASARLRKSEHFGVWYAQRHSAPSVKVIRIQYFLETYGPSSEIGVRKNIPKGRAEESPLKYHVLH
eukprot:9467301-Pyramimonas_sp.AAC.1